MKNKAAHEITRIIKEKTKSEIHKSSRGIEQCWLVTDNVVWLKTWSSTSNPCFKK